MKFTKKREKFLLKNSDLYINSSDFEGFPNSVVDAINYSVIILAVKHIMFKDLNYRDWLYNFSGTLIDSNNVLDGSKLRDLKKQGINVKAIGRGGL